MKQQSDELVSANKRLAFQNEEKEKRAQELILANKELAFQNEEKEKRAQELILANKELAFQNEEKEKRAQELILANKELAFQNEEKEKRAQELTKAINELQFIEKQLNNANKELEAFSYSVSHDLRTPLRAIGGFSAMLKEDYALELDAEANRIINVIIDNTKKMGELIDNLLSFSKMARLEAVNDTVDMSRLAKTCTEDLMQNEDQSKYAFTLKPLLPCAGDVNMLKQVWQNLIGNAIKYSSKVNHPKIEIGSIDNATFTIYYIKDNGAGFDMKYADKLFGVFQRLHRSDEFEGTGLGLALAKRIISKHRGDIWTESLFNVGTTFYFSIPKTTKQ